MTKKTISKYSLIVLGVAFLIMCACGLSDGIYKLPNEYELWHINSKEIIVGNKTSDNSITLYEDEKLIGIPANIVLLSYDERFVKAITIDPEDTQAYHESEKVNFVYYILDTSEKLVYGPFETEEDFMAALIWLEQTKELEWFSISDLFNI